MLDGTVLSQCLENWPTFAYRFPMVRSAQAPDSRRPDTVIMRSECEKGKAAGSPSGLPPRFWAEFGIVRGMDVVNHRETVPFTTADGSTIRELLAHRNSAIRQQSLAEARLKPGCATVPHHHAVTEEIYYILTGTAAMTLGHETRDVGPGDAIAIPPGMRHTIRNTGSEELVFLCTCAPGYEHTDTYLEPQPAR
jgi:mannose-6-phosphate isomerase-like protein (cupin superfamily)